mmetsp:Transcript_21388/g.20540  ORF Transcript_21388/g.20540 Transcript_21388/m.20540 type:complete len:95 (-) Transcript_21388:318-602(-)|eukprot:CAMPEP_0197830346 /NCGR_PEP_ID=MMETSP1437-20131217/6956_1 /TAXON_ID=49252 ORGANISM="Eucampia antarctica, Strain CCMP1452" /NCGR_SAMPLE_ID=MMETSP1437 /ASSEMBLY_ACC=CAM_ASM_001096 /LENGTH=94 /DNA_ID=CAMNT_0043432693 /DNA_START=421 /DNA_END=705 /DNA_ORIENTATION=+
MNDELRYKLRMMGIPDDGSTNIYYDNEAVVSNSSYSELTLEKKPISIFYHTVRECYAKGISRITYEPTATNLSDVCTKILSTEEKRKKLHHVVN